MYESPTYESVMNGIIKTTFSFPRANLHKIEYMPDVYNLYGVLEERIRSTIIDFSNCEELWSDESLGDDSLFTYCHEMNRNLFRGGWLEIEMDEVDIFNSGIELSFERPDSDSWLATEGTYKLKIKLRGKKLPEMRIAAGKGNDKSIRAD